MVADVRTAPARAAPAVARRGVGVLAAAHFVNDTYTYALQAVLPALIATLGLSLGLAGALVTIYQIVASFVQPAVGYLADRSSLRWPAWAGVMASGVAAGLLGLAPHYLALVGLLLLGGVGTAIFHPVSGAMVGAAAPAATRGKWLALYVTAGNFGNAFGPLAIGALIERWGVAGTWPIMLPALVAGALVCALAPPRPRPSRAAPSLPEVLRRHGRVLGALIAVVTLRAWATAALVTFIPLLGRARGLSLGEATLPLTAFLLVGACGSLVGGLAADRWGRDRVLVASLLGSVPFGLYVALGGDAGLGLLLAAAGAGCCLNGSFTALTIRGQESVPGNVGMVTGILLGLSVGLGGLAVTPLALLAERAGLSTAAALAAVLPLLAAMAVRWIPPAPRPA
ncbi:MAG TPA: MFS transporter [Chloroflexota bacterium]|nr:MFS transporter [Chloroflexota bacterium]